MTAWGKREGGKTEESSDTSINKNVGPSALISTSIPYFVFVPPATKQQSPTHPCYAEGGLHASCTGWYSQYWCTGGGSYGGNGKLPTCRRGRLARVRRTAAGPLRRANSHRRHREPGTSSAGGGQTLSIPRHGTATGCWASTVGKYRLRGRTRGTATTGDRQTARVFNPDITARSSTAYGGRPPSARTRITDHGSTDHSSTDHSSTDHSSRPPSGTRIPA